MLNGDDGVAGAAYARRAAAVARRDAPTPPTLRNFVAKAVDAFFDNDLFHATRTMLKRAKGSFGLCVTSTLDTSRQLVLAARGQTISIAFYPRAGLVLIGTPLHRRHRDGGYQQQNEHQLTSQFVQGRRGWIDTSR